jgi:amino acid adenylation domain-containing protein
MLRLDGRLEIAAFLQALRSLVRRHTILRTSFQQLPGLDVPVQVLLDTPLRCPLIDLSALLPAACSAQLEGLFPALRAQAIDVARPALRAHCLRLAPQEHALLCELPALCADEATLSELSVELGRAYQGLLHGETPEAEPLQYVDVAAWQEDLQREEQTRPQSWQRLDLLNLPQIQEPVATGQAAAFAPLSLSLDLGRHILEEVGKLAARTHSSIEACLLACWRAALWPLLAETHLIVGVACQGRPHEELAHVPGLYTRFVPVASGLAATLPFAQALALLQADLWQAREEQLGFQWPAEPGEMPASFPLCFTYQHWPLPCAAGQVRLSLAQRWICIEPFLWHLSILDTREQFQLELSYDPQRSSAAQAQRLLLMVQTILLHVLAQPGTPLGRLPLLSPPAQEQILRSLRGPQQPLAETPLHQIFAGQAARHPGHLAVIAGEQQLTYAQLNARANQLAHLLRRLGVGPNVLVGLDLPRTGAQLVALLGVLKAGGAYVPFDTANPPARLAQLVRAAQVSLLLSGQQRSTPVPVRVLEWEALQAELDQESEANPPAVGAPQDLAYVIYTSGSTGEPRGVMVSQRSVSSYTRALCTLLGAQPGWHYATVSTLAADLGNTSIFCALASGGCVQMPDYATITSGETLAAWVARYPLDVLKIVPSHLSALLSGEQQARLLPRRALLLGGETLPLSLLERIRATGSSCRLFNHYGPTETTIGVLVHEVSAQDALPASVPVGRPLANVEAYVLGPDRQVLPAGITGELYIGGVCLAYGYLHQPERTAGRFLPHPFSQQPGARLYRTGDLVRLDEQGRLLFVGRVDTQVKLRGYRIEPGEIVAALRRHPRVWDAAVILRTDPPAEPCLVGYVVARRQATLSPQELRAFLAQSLPDFLLPTHLLLLEQLPLTGNGKLDVAALPPPRRLPARQEREALPRGPLEEVLAEIWRDLLALPEIGIHDDFFRQGGHSLLVTRLIARLRAVLQVDLPINSLFAAPTIADFAPLVEQALHSEQVRAIPPLLPRERAASVPLSFAQQRLWFLDQLEPHSTAYLLPRVWRIEGALDRVALRVGLSELCNRHEILRTTFPARAGQPIQAIAAPGRRPLPLIDLCALEARERTNQERLLSAREAQQPCDLAAGPVLRAYLLSLEAGRHTLFLTMHHIISDAWSNDVLSHDLMALYTAARSGEAAALPPLPIQYADFAIWQRAWLRGSLLEQQLAYWRRQLAGVPILELPTDFPRPPVQTYQGAHQSLFLPLTLRNELLALSRQAGVTLFMLLLAAYQVLLMRYSGQEDISVGSAIANRARRELELLIGPLINTLVLRSSLAGNPSFLQLLARVHEVALGAYAHQDVPFEQLVDELQPERNLAHPPLFQVVFGLQELSAPRSPGEGEPAGGLSLRGLGGAQQTAKYDLLFYVTNSPYGLRCDVQYNTDLFSAQRIERLLEHWQVLLNGIVANPHSSLAALPLLTRQELHQVLVAWQAGAEQEAVPAGLRLEHLVTAQAQRSPDALALECAGAALTYGAFEARATRLAGHLRALGVVPEVVVGVYMPRSLELLTGQLAIFKAGGVYLPLDPTYPGERLAFIARDAGVRVLLTSASLPEPLARVPVAVLNLAENVAEAGPPLPAVGTGAHLAYILYTSGSTGRPKGVAITHTSLLNLLSWHQQAFALTRADRSSHFASPGFDASLWEVWPALTLGASLHIVAEQARAAPRELRAWLLERAITVSFVPTPLIAALLALNWPAQTALRLLLTGGDRLHQAPRPGLPFALVNNYGPTECSVVVSSQTLRAQSEASAAPPIGRPIARTSLYVLDRWAQLVPPGVTGELYVGGAGLARGYLGQAHLTAERFVPHPFALEAGQRLYRSGDLVRHLPDGSLEFVGRSDSQIKMRGFRIEPGEIEAVLEEHPAVHACHVLLREHAEGGAQLLAYVVGHPQIPLAELSQYAAGRLPDYMLPTHLLVLPELPLTPNGKIDRAALPGPAVPREAAAQGEQEATTPIQGHLAAILTQLLAVEQVRLDDNFFLLGGHSLLGAQVITRISETFAIEFPLRTLFNAPTVRLLAAEVERQLRERVAQMSEEEALALLGEHGH